MLIEIGGSHDECLLSQMVALKSNNTKVTLITTQKILNRNIQFESWCDQMVVFENDLEKRDLLKNLKAAYSRLKKEGNIDRLILNTAQGWVIKRFCLSSFFDGVSFVGIFHDGLKYKSSLGQKLIKAKVSKQIFLSEFLLEFCGKSKNKAFFYPLRFEHIIDRIDHEGINIAIIGGVETIKKDVTGFIDNLLDKTPSNVHYYFLGRSEKKWPEVNWFDEQVKIKNAENRITTFDEFLSPEEFAEYLSKTDAILSLIHPGTPSGEIYFKSKISGSMNVALGHQIPLLLEESLTRVTELRDAAIYYNFDNYRDIISNKKSLQERGEVISKTERYQMSFQERKYAKFVLGD